MTDPTNPGWVTGYVPSAEEWNETFGGKVDFPAPLDQGGTGALSALAGNYNLQQRMQVVAAHTSSAPLTLYAVRTDLVVSAIALPAASACRAGDWIDILDTGNNAAAHNITVATAGSDTILVDGTSSSSLVLSTSGISCVLVSDGASAWRAIVTPSPANMPVSTAQAAALVNKTIATVAVSGTTFTIDATYRNKTLETTAANPIVALFAPTMPVGACGVVTQCGAGQISFFTTGTGAIREALGYNRTIGQWSEVAWYCRANSDGASAEIVLSGDLMGFAFESINMLPTSSALSVTEGIAYDGQYLYVTPHNLYVIAKIDLVSFSVVGTLDLSTVDAGLIALSTSFAVGQYLYITPHFTSGPVYQTKVVRVDLNNFTTAGVALLTVIVSPSGAYQPHDGFTDGTYGYVNVRTTGGMTVVRFGLGAEFLPGNVFPITLTTTTGADGVYPIKDANFLYSDGNNVYGIARCATVLTPTVIADMWLVAIPVANFQSSAAVFTRITRNNFVAPAVPNPPYQLIDDLAGNLWTFPLVLFDNSTYLPPMKIPKGAPGTTVITTPPAGQLAGIATGGQGQAIYDGARYGYAVGVLEPTMMQLDTQRPGVINYINIAAASGGPAMWGLGKAGNRGFAVSFTDALGLLMRFTMKQ